MCPRYGTVANYSVVDPDGSTLIWLSWIRIRIGSILVFWVLVRRMHKFFWASRFGPVSQRYLFTGYGTVANYSVVDPDGSTLIWLSWIRIRFGQC
jgi:hypothetical protein